jgi:DNA-binding MarR family transcriptional regulator
LVRVKRLSESSTLSARPSASAHAHDFIIDFIVEHGHVPSVREIAAAIGRSPSTVHRHLRELERDGLIRRRPGLARSLVLVSGGQASERERDCHRERERYLDREREAIASLGEMLEEQAASFEADVARAEAIIGPGVPVTREVMQALRAACFHGYAVGVRWAAAQIASDGG